MAQAPDDLISLSEAQKITGRSRPWIMKRIKKGESDNRPDAIRGWEQGGVYKVSRSDVVRANAIFMELRPLGQGQADDD